MEIRIEKRHFVRVRTGKMDCPFARPNDALGTPGGNDVGNALAYVFRDLELKTLPKSASLQVTALGIYELWANGRRVSERYFAPGWTDYHKLLYVQEYDLTPFLGEGANRFGAVLGDGWFAGNLSYRRKETYGYRQPEIAMVLTLDYSDHKEVIGSDEGFRFLETNIRYADFYMGQWTDLALPGAQSLSLPGVPGQPVILGDGTGAQLQADPGLAVMEEQRLGAVSVTPLGDRLVVDFGQDFVGVVSLKVKSLPGAQVTVCHGEMLNADGSVYTDNLRGAVSIDRYICAGGNEILEPRFTFHGFRYAEVEMKDAELIEAEGVVLTTELPRTGDFLCDNELVNQLYSNIIWGMKGNFLELPTDCPQRDERLGWLGDAQVFCPTAMYNRDCREFYVKYLRNIRDAINAEGAPYDLAPYVKGLGYGTAAWADAIVVIPYELYRFYGDTAVIRENLAAMEDWIGYMERTSTELIRPDSGYGDWLSVRVDETPKDLLGTAYFAYTAELLSELCGAIGEEEKQAHYHGLSRKVKEAFCRRFVAADGTVGTDSQCGYLLALAFRLVPPEQESVMADKLVAAIHRDDDHLTCGFVGVGLLLPVLSQIGRNDLAYKILLNETYPSWGYSIRNGATTVWERWNSWTEEGGFGDVGMNSFNHYSLGSCGAWFAGFMCGIQPAAPGFTSVLVAPQLDPENRIREAQGYYRMDWGVISSAWQVGRGIVHFRVGIPAGIEAVLRYKETDFPLQPGMNVISLPL